MDITKALEKLFALHTFGIKLGLDNIKDFLKHLGNPQNKLKIFHIAGSNGKGSTTSFLASILIEHGYKTGIYTSPHFIRFNERIKIGKEEISDDYAAGFVTEYESYIDEHKLTFFEVTTAMAFKYFAENHVDYAVIETGLGGRLDATNSVNSLVSVITSISLEHTNLLGDTIAKIAYEKAEIIKPNSYALAGLLNDTAIKTIEEKCRVVGTDLFCLKHFYNQQTDIFHFKDIKIDFNEVHLPLKGNHQKFNASLAVMAARLIIRNTDYNKTVMGLTNVIFNTDFSGRYEYYNTAPDIIFDSAHNPEGVRSFIEEFQKDYKKYESANLLFSALKDKNIKEMLKTLKPYFDKVYIAELTVDRGTPISDLLELAGELGIEAIPVNDASKFVIDFAQNKPNTCLAVLGSMYLVGEIKRNLRRNNA
jgi:dihydrofolate synthase/folylpolyglutamate synthase